MQFLSITNIIELHKMSIDQFGGIHGVRDIGLLESALAYPEMLHNLAQEEDLLIIAASYAYHLIKNHAFIDGNKRIGTLAAITLLKMNGLQVIAHRPSLYQFAMDIAESKISEEEAPARLRQCLFEASVH